MSLTGHYKETVLTEDITDGSIIVFTAMFPSGWHAMTAQYNDGKYWVYNQYNRSAITYDYQSLSGAYEGGIFIYGVRIDP